MSSTYHRTRSSAVAPK